MEIGHVRVAEDRDFERLKSFIDNHQDWKLEYNKGTTLVWTKTTDHTGFKMIKLKCTYADIEPSLLYDVLHDPDYRKHWDKHMLDAYDVGCLNPNNDVGYYALSCPPPLRNRDFVLQRSWLDIGNELYILNHSVYHQGLPPKKGFIRALSYLTGYLIRPIGEHGCELGYVSHSDPQGALPPWVVNKLTQIFAPKMVKRLHKACMEYPSWKEENKPYYKPWIYPEQISLPRIPLTQFVRTTTEINTQLIDESCFDEESCKELDFTDDSDDL